MLLNILMPHTNQLLNVKLNLSSKIRRFIAAYLLNQSGTSISIFSMGIRTERKMLLKVVEILMKLHRHRESGSIRDPQQEGERISSIAVFETTGT